MSRQRDKGTRFETQVVEYLNRTLGGSQAHRLGLKGSMDEGDVWGLFAHGQRVVVECKDVARMALSQWVGEAEDERGNADALAGVVVHKRRGFGPARMGGTYVTMTLADLVAICTGARPGEGDVE